MKSALLIDRNKRRARKISIYTECFVYLRRKLAPFLWSLNVNCVSITDDGILRADSGITSMTTNKQ